MGILFTCAEKECRECSQNTTSFVTDNPEVAAKHSEQNEVKMWISEHEDQEALSMLQTYEQFNR